MGPESPCTLSKSMARQLHPHSETWGSSLQRDGHASSLPTASSPPNSAMEPSHKLKYVGDQQQVTEQDVMTTSTAPQTTDLSTRYKLPSPLAGRGFFGWCKLSTEEYITVWPTTSFLHLFSFISDNEENHIITSTKNIVSSSSNNHTVDRTCSLHPTTHQNLLLPTSTPSTTLGSELSIYKNFRTCSNVMINRFPQSPLRWFHCNR